MRNRTTEDGQPSNTTIEMMYETAAIINATPPGEPTTCVALSAENRGYRAPRPVASPVSAKLMNVMPTAVTIFKKGATARNSFATIVSVRLRISSGTSPDQNFDHRKSRYEIGAVLIIQNAAPSDDTAGNTNRAATVAITNPASPRLRNA